MTYKESIGNLVLVKKRDNQSLGDKHPSEKIKYYRDSILAETLREDFYTHNPAFRKFMEKYNLDFRHYEKFDRDAIQHRIELYGKMFRIIYSPDNFDKILNGEQNS